MKIDVIEEVPQQYARVKGADWFDALYKRPVMILGQGGIGSHLSFLVSRLGCDLYLFDHDIYETANMTGQIVTHSALGQNKAEAMKDLLSQLSPDCNVVTFGKYEKQSETNDIVLCGFDNMEARKMAFDNWKEYVLSLPEKDRKQCLFMDGRLTAEVLQILSISGDNEELMEKYEKEYLFSDDEVQELNCTFKQTSHCAAMIASQMTAFLTNWAFNVKNEKAVRKIPFFHEYLVPLNFTTNEF